MKLGLLFIGLLVAVVVAEPQPNDAVDEAPVQLIDELDTPLIVDENGARDKRTLLLKKKILLKKALLLGG